MRLPNATSRVARVTYLGGAAHPETVKSIDAPDL